MNIIRGQIRTQNLLRIKRIVDQDNNGDKFIIAMRAKNIEFMIFARILQGFGGGGILPISQAIIIESFPKEKRGIAMSVFGMGVILAPIIGPVLGGWITDNWT